MSYKKPGVEVTQITRLNTPTLVAPEITTVVVGPGYDWVEPSVQNENALLDTEYTGTNLVISGISTDWIANSVVVDLIQKSNGAVISLLPGSFSINGGNLQISENLADSACSIIVGYAKPLATAKLDRMSDVGNLEEVELVAGAPVSWNPAGFAASVLMQNSGSSTSVIPISEDSTSGHSTAIEILETKDVYAISVASQTSGVGALYKAHVTSMSLPENKKERIAFFSPAMAYNTGEVTLSGNKNLDATEVQTANSAFASKRYFSIHPDVVYVRESRHVSTLRAAFSAAMFGASFNSDAKHLFAQRTVIDGQLYKAGDEITDALVTSLIGLGVTRMEVFSACPGSYYTAQIVGQIAGTAPAQPLTNVPGAGLSRVYRSNTYYNEAQLNTMASGGTWIMVQDNPSSPVYTRHQLSTDNTQTTTKEMSITKSVDFSAKFMRNSLKPYIGRMVIDDAFLDLVYTVLVGTAFYLKRRGVVRDLKIGTIAQDEINPDTINVEASILPLYPANYIKIKLVI